MVGVPDIHLIRNPRFPLKSYEWSGFEYESPVITFLAGISCGLGVAKVSGPSGWLPDFKASWFRWLNYSVGLRLWGWACDRKVALVRVEGYLVCDRCAKPKRESPTRPNEDVVPPLLSPSLGNCNKTASYSAEPVVVNFKMKDTSSKTSVQQLLLEHRLVPDS